MPDNLKAAVLQADWFDPELNPKIRAFCEHYCTALLPTKPAMPRHKGKIEAGVKYAQANALKGRTFGSLAVQNTFLAEWERTVADTRLHGTIRQQVGTYFARAEQPALRPLPASLFPCFEEAPRKVHRDGHVAFQRAYYSVPPVRLGRDVWVRAEGRLVRIFNQHFEPIAVHVRAEPGRFATDEAHIHAHKSGSSSSAAPTTWWSVAGWWVPTAGRGRKACWPSVDLRRCSPCRACCLRGWDRVERDMFWVEHTEAEEWVFRLVFCWEFRTEP